jgi:nucleoside-diphosphate-sugar epimerase
MSNLQMGSAVCQTLETGSCRHFVYLSSDAVYDADSTPLDETSAREPRDLYSLAHTAREMMLGSVLAARGIPYCCLRPTNVYGPGNTHDSYGPNRFVRTALSDGRIALFGLGEEQRSHLFVRDAVELMVRVIGRQSVGILNLANSPAISFRAIADAVISHCPIPVRLEFEARKGPVVQGRNEPSQTLRILHRPFDVSEIFRAFPDFNYTPLETGIDACFRALQQPSHPTESPGRVLDA